MDGTAAGLRQEETFGIRVEHVIDQGRYGLLAVEEQGGRWFAIRDEDDELAKRRWMGHRAGHDVFGRHYVLDDPTLALMKGLADGVDEQVRQEVGDLMVPTAVRHQWGREHPIRARLEFADGRVAVRPGRGTRHPDRPATG